MKKANVEQLSETRTRYSFSGKCKAGGNVIVDMTKCEPNNESPHSLPVMWAEHGYIDRVLPNYWHVEVFAYDKYGDCWGLYNPQIIKGKNKIDFAWMLEATEENKTKLLDEVCRLAF